MSASSLRERRPFVSADPFSRPGSAGFFHRIARSHHFQLALGSKPVEKKADIYRGFEDGGQRLATRLARTRARQAAGRAHDGTLHRQR